MSHMSSREAAALDNYITGHYGEDQFQGEEDDDLYCPECGGYLEPGDWPFCPHGRGAYSFRLKGPGFHKNDYPGR